VLSPEEVVALFDHTGILIDGSQDQKPGGGELVRHHLADIDVGAGVSRKRARQSSGG